MGGMASRGGSRSGSRSSRRSGLMSEINVVPYIDVMLVLLVIFMATAPLLPPGTIDLPKLGKSNNRPDAFIEVQIGAKGDVQVKAVNAVNSAAAQAETKTTTAELANVIKKMRAGSDMPVVISADKSVRYEAVMKAMDELQKENISRVGLMVKRQ